LFDKLNQVEEHYKHLCDQMVDPEIAQNPAKYTEIAKEKSSLDETIDTYQEYKSVMTTITEDESVISENSDADLIELAEQELAELYPERDRLEEKLRLLLLPKDPNDTKNAIVEIRAGTGGEEAGIFAGDLFRMYSRFAELNGWKIDVMNSNPQGIGGFKEIIFMLKGNNCYGLMKYESGVHRVQRVPKTEASGRIHTSAASVAVLPEADEVEIQIDQSDLKIDVYRSSGPGGQSVNTTDSAVRITHLPTGMVVTCQDEKSQHKNRAKALKVLKARLYEAKQREEQAKLAESRRSMVSTGDRSAKIRTYNFPQGRLTDHRINLTLYRLEEILDGDLDEVMEKLRLAEQADALERV
jgi:peptide chain release factor 1